MSYRDLFIGESYLSLLIFLLVSLLFPAMNDGKTGFHLP